MVGEPEDAFVIKTLVLIKFAKVSCSLISFRDAFEHVEAKNTFPNSCPKMKKVKETIGHGS